MTNGSEPRREAPGTRLAFLDGLRGLAALYVVLHHASQEVAPSALSGIAAVVRFLLRHGHSAVAVFIVLSGYCLMRPLALAREEGPRGGTRAYLGRRARRILPPYYAALGFSWILILAVPGLQHPCRSRWDRALPAFEPGVIASHLLLVHNLHDRWIAKVDPPLWSVATEGQIYLLFPMLLAIWRRCGIAATVAAGFAVGMAVAALSVVLGEPALGQLCPWYAGLFTLGMAGALDRAPSEGGRAATGRAGYVLAAGLGAIAVALAGFATWGGVGGPVLLTDIVAGLLAVALIVRCARREARGGVGSRGPALPLLESRGAAALGTFSYSLYLIHDPLLALVAQAVRGRGLGPNATLAVMLGIAAPLCVIAAYLFHVAFERGSTRGRASVSAPILEPGVHSHAEVCH